MRKILHSRWLKPVIVILALVPLVFMAAAVLSGTLANPIEYITHGTGDWTLRFLLITLAITPLRWLLQQPDLIRVRRLFGLAAFCYGFLHLMTWLWLDKFFDPHEMIADVIKRRFITMGMLGFVLMIPLAITSTRGWIRRLGKNWLRLHRLIYLSALAGVIHYWWLVKSDIRLPLLYGVILFVLLGLRVVKARQSTRPETVGALRAPARTESAP